MENGDVIAAVCQNPFHFEAGFVIIIRMPRGFSYVILLGVFVMNIPLAFAFPDAAHLEILQAVVTDMQKKVANADYFLEKTDTLKALNDVRKKSLEPVEGLKNITEFLENIAHLPLAEQRYLIKKIYEETVLRYEAAVKEDKKTKTKIVYKNETDYIVKVRQRQALHEALPRMEWEALALEEANARGSRAGIAFAEQEAARLLKEGESALLVEQGKPSYRKINKNSVQPHDIPVQPASTPPKSVPDAVFVNKARESAKLASGFLESPVQHFFDPLTGDLKYQVRGDKNRMQILTPEQLAERIVKEGNQLSSRAGDSMRTLKALEALESLDAVTLAQKQSPSPYVPRDPNIVQKPIERIPKNKPTVVVPNKPPVRFVR